MSNNNTANTNFSSTLKDSNTSRYFRDVKVDRASSSRNLWNEISSDRKDHEQYKLIAYTNDMNCRYTIQFQNNMMLPVYLHRNMGLHLHGFKHLDDMMEPAVMFVEAFTISDSMQLKELMEYYSNTPLIISDNKQEDLMAMDDIITMLSREIFPATIRIAHIVKMNNHKHERKTYIPNLNIVLYKTGMDLKYAGEHPRSKEAKKEFNVSPKKSREDINLYQHYFKIIDNEEPYRKYYIRMFNNVVEIESSPSMASVENSCIKMAFYQEERLIEEEILEGLSDENLKSLGIYKTRTEAEGIHDISKIIEKAKLDIELNKLNLNGTDMMLKATSMKNNFKTTMRKTDLEDKKLDLEFNKLEIDRSRLILDREKVELDFSKLYKDTKLLERSYRNEIGKLNIGLIKEATDTISVVIRLASIIKSFFSKD